MRTKDKEWITQNNIQRTQDDENIARRTNNKEHTMMRTQNKEQRTNNARS